MLVVPFLIGFAVDSHKCSFGILKGVAAVTEQRGSFCRHVLACGLIVRCGLIALSFWKQRCIWGIDRFWMSVNFASEQNSLPVILEYLCLKWCC